VLRRWLLINLYCLCWLFRGHRFAHRFRYLRSRNERLPPCWRSGHDRVDSVESNDQSTREDCHRAQRCNPTPAASPIVGRGYPMLLARQSLSIKERYEASFKLFRGARHGRIADSRMEGVIKVPAHPAVSKVLAVTLFQNVEDAPAHALATSQGVHECFAMYKHHSPLLCARWARR
jgi:hypothetical protein